MAFEIKQREREGVTIFDIEGKLLLGEAASKMREVLEQSRDSGLTRVILNLENCDYIDSTGLGTLVMGATSMQRRGGTLKLLQLNKRNIELMVMTKLTTIFEIFQDEQDAVNSFFPDRQINRFDILEFVKGQKGPQKAT